MNADLLNKFETLLDWFRQQEDVTVAYSGGVDSALLLYVGTKVLGDKKCQGFFAETCLVSSNARKSCLAFAKSNQLKVQVLPLDPLEFSGFKFNKSDRCYICKKKTYQFFLQQIVPGSRLADGSHCDDFSCDRPGFKAVKELQVATPFVDCSIDKFDIRSLSYHLGLTTWAKLSDSCLATRVKYRSEVTLKDLRLIEHLEDEFSRIGLVGCRVTICNDRVYLSVSSGHVASFTNGSLQSSVFEIIKRFNFSKVFLDLSEREGILPSLLDYIGFTGDKGPKKRLATYFN